MRKHVGSNPTAHRQFGTSDKKHLVGKGRRVYPTFRANNSVVECQISNLLTRVRFPIGAHRVISLFKTNILRYGLAVRIGDFPSFGPGSTPGIGILSSESLIKKIHLVL